MQDKDREGRNRRKEMDWNEREKRDREDRDYSEDRSNTSSIRIKEESLLQDAPPTKRLMLDDDVSLNMRMTPIGLPGANIKITSRGTATALIRLNPTKSALIPLNPLIFVWKSLRKSRMDRINLLNPS